MTSPLCSDGCKAAEDAGSMRHACERGCVELCRQRKPEPLVVMAEAALAAGLSLAALSTALEAARPSMLQLGEALRRIMRDAALDRQAELYRAWGWACYLVPDWWRARRVARECGA